MNQLLQEQYERLGISPEVSAFGEKIEASLKQRFEEIDARAEYNQLKVLKAMQDNRVSAGCFNYASGYVYDGQGTRNFLKEPAMTGEEVYQAMQTGMDLVLAGKQKGYQLLGIGEMGIGNTTTSAAMTAVMLGLSADTVTGKGAGLDEQGLTHKKEVIEQALLRYGLRETDTFTILQTVGGLDIAAMAGAIIGGAVYHMPIVLDGVISLVAALVAERLLPNVRDFLIPSHRSKEPAAEKISEKLRLDPVIDAKMAVGEGTGAVMMLTLLKQAALVYQSCNSFEAAGVEQYKRYTK